MSDNICDCGLSLENIKSPNIKVECYHDGSYWIQLADDEPSVSIHPGDTIEVRWRLEYPKDGGPPRMYEVVEQPTGTSTSSSAPDSFIPLVGYRAWRLTSDGRLRSTAHDYVWDSGEQIATCSQSANGHHVSYELFRLREQAKDDPATLAVIDQAMMDAKRSPERNCQCGFYALYDVLNVSSRVGNSPGLVYGRIKAWGKIAQFDDGFRAEKVELDTLFLPRGLSAWRRYKVKKIARQYGVSTEPSPEGIPSPDDTTPLLFAMFWMGLVVAGAIGATLGGGIGYSLVLAGYIGLVIAGGFLYEKITARKNL